MPRVAPLIPRKMFPPPTTIAISTPRSVRAAATSSAIRWATAASIPKPTDSSANASPESFSTTRPNRLWATPSPPVSSLPSAAARRTPRLLLADLDPREAADGGATTERPEQLRDRRLRVTHERLLGQHVILVEALEPALDDHRDLVLGLALVARELLEDGALLVEGVGRDLVTGDVARRRARNVERDVVRDLARLGIRRVDAAELHEHADHAALVLRVLVAVEQAVARLVAHNPAELDLLTEARAELLDRVRDLLAVIGLVGEVVLALLRDELRQTGDRVLEVVALGDEVGLAVELDDRADVAVDGDVHRALRRGAPGALARAGETLGAQPVLGRLDVAVRRLERVLAVHHPGAGLLAQRRDVLRGVASHSIPPSRRRPRYPRLRSPRSAPSRASSSAPRADVLRARAARPRPRPRRVVAARRAGAAPRVRARGARARAPRRACRDVHPCGARADGPLRPRPRRLGTSGSRPGSRRRCRG